MMVASDEGNEQGAKKPFFSGGAGDSATSHGERGIGPGAEVGPYKLIGVLGEGGYGIVYLASQDGPIRRRVALKIVKPGMDSRQVIARFEAERQALALLDHPNVAHVYDAGTTPQGRPYFAMEYIEGLPVTEYCDRQNLDLKERLGLFLQVCSAVQHAHQKGIIHRDLKPSNLLVAAGDGKPLVKVIDFGIAKALSQPLTEQTLYTEQGQFSGTPDYMSPEQAEMNGHGVDTRSDVYSLGVVLYELLTGVLPFDPADLRSGGVDQIRTVIRDEQPRTPSTRLTSLGAPLDEIAQRRRTDPQALARTLRRELEWIPLKAIRKEPSRRYQSVSDLAADIENYLEGIPLLAGPESVLYRAKKFVCRHSGAVAATILVAASLLTGLTASTTLYLRAENAQMAEESQRKAAEQERDRATTAEQEATRRLVDLYEEQARRYMELGDLDRALVLLAEALKHDGGRLSTLLLAQECLRTHPDPNLNTFTSLVPWKGELPSGDVSFATSPDRKVVAFAGEGDPVIRVFDTETAEPRIQLKTGKISKLAFVPGNHYLLARGESVESHHSIHVFDLQTGEQSASIRRANAHIDKVLAFRQGALPSREVIEKYYTRVLLNRDGNWFAFLDLDDSGSKLQSWVSLWDFSRSTLFTSERYESENTLLGVAYRPASAYGIEPVLVSGDCRSYFRTWYVPRLEPEGEFFFDAVGGTLSNTRNVGINRNGALYIIDRLSNRLIRTVPDTVAHGLNPDASRLLTQTVSGPPAEPVEITQDCSVDLWDMGDGRHIAQLCNQTLANWHFSPDGRLLITEHHNSEIHVWSSVSGSPVFTIPAEANHRVTDISPGGEWLITHDCGTRDLIDVWSLTTGERFRPYAIDPACRDIESGWATEEVDRVFSCSQSTPSFLSRLNANGSALICRAGILPLDADPAHGERIADLVACRVPFRLEDGRIRRASEKEVCLARVDCYGTRMSDQERSETIECLLRLVSNALDQNDVADASRLMGHYLALPPTDDEQTARHARELTSRLAGAYRDLGYREERCGRHGAALEEYTRALCLRDDYPEVLSRLAWVLATSPEQQVRDPIRAVAESRRACDLTGWSNWEHLSTYAAACAANSAFTEAMRWQKRAIELLPLSEEGRWGENLRLRLRSFESQKPYDRRQFYNVPGGNLLCWWTPEGVDDGTLHDRAGRGHTAKTVGGVRWLTDNGRTVLDFYGAEAGVQCPKAPDLDVRDTLSVVTWVRYSPLERKPDWLRQQAVGRGYSWALIVMPETHSVIFECQGLDVPGVAPCSYVIGKTSLNDSRWHQIAGVYDSRALTVYVDGRLDGTEGASGLLLVDDESVALGKGMWYVATWRELMRDVRIYDCALSAQEIAELYEATK